MNNRGRGAAVVVGLPQTDGSTPSAKQAFAATGGNVTLITLNSEGMPGKPLKLRRFIMSYE